MDIVKYFVGPSFNKEKFVDVLKYQLNVPSWYVLDGIILDRDALAIAPAVSTWVEMNREDIMSNLHTRPASEEEIFLIKNPDKFQLYSLGTPIARSNSMESLRESARTIYNLYIVDMETGEVVWES